MTACAARLSARSPSGCDAQLLVPEVDIAVDLPEGKTIPVEFTPTQPGEYEVIGGMKMNFYGEHTFVGE